MRHGKLSAAARAVVLCMLGVTICAGGADAATLTGMSVSTEGEVTRIHVMLDEPVEFSHFALTDPARLFVDVRGVDTVLPKSLPAGMGRVGQIEASVWQGDGAQQAMTRITMDLGGASDTNVEQVEDGLLVTVGPSEGEFSPTAPQSVDTNTAPQNVDTPTSAETDIFEGLEDFEEFRDVEASESDVLESIEANEAEPVPTMEPTSTTEPAMTMEPTLTMEPVTTSEPTTPAEDSILDELEDELNPDDEAFEYELPAKEYTKVYERSEPTAVASFGDHEEGGLSARGGARVSLDIQGADIYTVLRSISEYSGVNIVMGYDVPEEVTNTVSFHLENVPWGEALEMVLRSAHLWYREEGNIIRVDTEENLRNEELARSNAARALEEVMPLITRIIEVVYANAGEMKPTIEKTLSRRGVTEVDFRTNSLVITDIRPRVQAAVEMVQHLDSQTPQIEIVAKMVDVDSRFQRDLGVIWGVGGIHSNEGASLEAIAGANDVVDPTSVIRFGVVRSWGTVSAVLSAMERENKANIISNPRITTVNNRMARILVGKKIPLIVLDEAGNAVTELVTIGITLRVTPHINDNNRITLDLHPEVSDLAAQATVQGGVIINTSEADTRVMVNNGETAVIGGLIRSNESMVERGVPILKDIPLIGSFFKNSSKIKEKRELLIFVTPRIINAFSAENDN